MNCPIYFPFVSNSFLKTLLWMCKWFGMNGKSRICFFLYQQAPPIRFCLIKYKWFRYFREILPKSQFIIFCTETLYRIMAVYAISKWLLTKETHYIIIIIIINFSSPSILHVKWNLKYHMNFVRRKKN